MRGAFCLTAALLLASVPAQSQTDALRQLEGLWTVEWVAGGNSQVEQVQFNRDALGGHIVTLPFLPGLATVTRCEGRQCSGANIVVSGTGFDCLYAYSIYDRNAFAWTYKDGSGGCPPSAKFRKDPPL